MIPTCTHLKKRELFDRIQYARPLHQRAQQTLAIAQELHRPIELHQRSLIEHHHLQEKYELGPVFSIKENRIFFYLRDHIG